MDFFFCSLDAFLLCFRRPLRRRRCCHRFFRLLFVQLNLLRRLLQLHVLVVGLVIKGLSFTALRIFLLQFAELRLQFDEDGGHVIAARAVAGCVGRETVLKKLKQENFSTFFIN